jgi:hypothetical protein
MASTHYQQLIDWLTRRPNNERLCWTDESLSSRKPFVFPWVDVIIPQLHDDTDLNWALSYRTPDQPLTVHDDPAVDLRLRYDATFSVRLEQELPIEATLYPDVGDPIDLAPLVPDLLASWDLYWAKVMIGDDVWASCRAWTPTAISQAITEWVDNHTGRRDLAITWDPDICLTEPDLVVGTDPGHGYQIGENIYASEAVFDELLHMDLDQAAELTQRFRELGEQFRPH